MADLTDPAFWQRQLDAFIAAPVPSGIFLVLGALGAWWFRGTTDRGQIEGFKAQAENHKAQIAVLEERLRFAAEKVQERDQAKQQLKEDLKELRGQIEAGASKLDIAAASEAAANSFISFNGRDEEVRSIMAEAYMRALALTGPDLDPPDRLSNHIPLGFRKTPPKN